MSENNHNFIKEVGGMTDEEYNHFLFEMGCQFVEKFAPNQASEMKKLGAYWLWWKQQHERMDIRFSQKYGTKKLLGMTADRAKREYEVFHKSNNMVDFRQDSYVNLQKIINNKTRSNDKKQVQTRKREAERS